jgi:Tol biopolymer transport system component
VGLSPDARVAIFQNNPDRFFYRTASGVEGEISVALPPLDDGWGHDFSLESMRYATMTQVHHSGVRILDLATGQARDLLPGNVATSAPAWSPDGRRLAVLIGNLSRYEIAIMNADGSGQRRYPLPTYLNGWGRPWGYCGAECKSWSPDGRFLAFRARDRREVVEGNARERTLLLLDVKSGKTRTLATGSPNIGPFVWQSDGKAIRAIKATDPVGSPHQWSIVEIPLNGAERLLRNISAEFPKVNDVVFASDTAVVVTVTSDKKTERFLVPLGGGGVRRLPDPGTEPGLRMGPTPMIAGNHALILQLDARDESPVITSVSTVNDSTRRLRLPFAANNGAPYPDGKHIILTGKAAGDSQWKLFLVPLDGSAARLLGEIPHGDGGVLAPSPDGKLLAYTSEGLYTTKILDVDFGPALQALAKR